MAWSKVVWGSMSKVVWGKKKEHPCHYSQGSLSFKSHRQLESSSWGCSGLSCPALLVSEQQKLAFLGSRCSGLVPAIVLSSILLLLLLNVHQEELFSSFKKLFLMKKLLPAQYRKINKSNGTLNLLSHLSGEKIITAWYNSLPDNIYVYPEIMYL